MESGASYFLQIISNIPEQRMLQDLHNTYSCAYFPSLVSKYVVVASNFVTQIENLMFLMFNKG